MDQINDTGLYLITERNSDVSHAWNNDTCFVTSIKECIEYIETEIAYGQGCNYVMITDVGIDKKGKGDITDELCTNQDEYPVVLKKINIESYPVYAPQNMNKMEYYCYSCSCVTFVDPKNPDEDSEGEDNIRGDTTDCPVCRCTMEGLETKF